MRTRNTLTVLLAAMVLSACAGGGSGAVEEQGGATDVTSIAADATASGSPTDGQEQDVDGTTDPLGVSAAIETGRKVITNATVELEAKDTRGAYDALVTAVEGSGGFMADASISDPQGKKDQPVVARHGPRTRRGSPRPS